MTVFLLLIWSLPSASFGQSFEEQFVTAINELRARGCRCAGKRLPRAKAVIYNELLSISAYNHVVDIRRQRRLNHYSINGLNIGERIEKVGYDWLVVGENLAWGQRTIDEVIQDWIASKSHCNLLLDQRFDEVGFAKLGTYWVLHFGKRKS